MYNMYIPDHLHTLHNTLAFQFLEQDTHCCDVMYNIVMSELATLEDQFHTSNSITGCTKSLYSKHKGTHPHQPLQVPIQHNILKLIIMGLQTNKQLEHWYCISKSHFDNNNATKEMVNYNQYCLV